MARTVNYARIGKELAINRMLDEAARGRALVAVASIGNLSSANKYKVRYGLERAGGTINFTKNTLKVKALEQLGAEAEELKLLLRGKTVLACGPADVPLAKELLELEKAMPDFFVLGALLNGQRILQVRTTPLVAAPDDTLHGRTHAITLRPRVHLAPRPRSASLRAQANEVERLSKLPSAADVHVNMVCQMLPGTALQVPNVGAYLVSVLSSHVDALRAAEGSGS